MNKRVKYASIVCMLLFLNVSVINTVGLSTESTKEINESNEKITTTVNGLGDCALFITGGGEGSSLLEDTANDGADIFRANGYNTRVISYSNNNFPLVATIDAIINWIPNNLEQNGQIFIYIGAHSDTMSTLVIGYIARIPQISLKQLINIMDSRCNSSVITIAIESCQSGRFINTLKGPDRIIMTATDALHFSYFNPVREYVYFSTPFFDALSRGKSYGEAWEYADSKVDGIETRRNTSIELQDPQINDGSTDGTAFVDTLTPRNRLALRVYPSHISKSKTIDCPKNLIKFTENFPILKNIIERFFQQINKNEVN